MGLSNEGCSLYTTLSMNVAGSSVPSGPTTTTLIDHFRIGKPSAAGGTSARICYTQSDHSLESLEFKEVPVALQA